MSVFSVQHVACSYDREPVLTDISFGLDHGDICCLLGPSGCGKTTLLRAIAGFQKLDNGSISLDQQELSSATCFVTPERRQIGMVFQDYALFPHLNVCNNITFGLHKKSRAEQEHACETMLALVQLEGLGQRFPHELSGGQQQRIALARALAPKPKLLLMDEPFSSLDVDLRRQLATEVRSILKKTNITAIMVTHDQEEAFAMADKVGVINQGQLEQWDSPYNLYHEPATRFVAKFIGKGVFLPGTMLSDTSINTELGTIAGNRCYPWPEKTPVSVMIRPDDVIYNPESPTRALIVNKIFAGTSILYTLQLPTGSQVEAAFPSHVDHKLGDHIGVTLQADHLIAFSSGARA